MDAKNQQDRAKMVEEAVGRMCRLGMMPQVITKFRKQGTVLKSETAGILYDLNDEEKKAVADWEEESGGIVYAAIAIWCLEDAWRCCMLVQRKKSGNWIEKTWTGGFHLRMWRTWMHRIVPNWEVSELHLQTVDW